MRVDVPPQGSEEEDAVVDSIAQAMHTKYAYFNSDALGWFDYEQNIHDGSVDTFIRCVLDELFEQYPERRTLREG